MSVVRALQGLCLLLCAVGCAPAKGEAERVVAVVRGRTVAYADVRCPNSFRNESAERCHQREQESIRTRIIENVIDCSAQIARADLTAGEVEKIEKQIHEERSEIRRLTDRHLAVLRAVLRVQEGEKLADVVADSAGAGIRAHDIETQIRYLDDAAATRKALAEDYLSAAAGATRAEMRRALLVEKLRSYVTERAVATGRTPEEAEASLVESAVRTCEIRILDSSYQMPDLTGVFKVHVQQIQLR